MPVGGRCERRIQPAGGAAVQGGGAGIGRSADALRLPQPCQLPAGGVLVVGASATGVQLAAELARAGRPVTLSVGEHVRMPRTYRGRDVLWWMEARDFGTSGTTQVDDLARARRLPSPQLVGTPERTTLDLNALADLGVEMVGRWATVRDGRALFSGGLRNVFSLADLKLERLLDSFDDWARGNDSGATSARPTLPRRPGSLHPRGGSSTCAAARSAPSSGPPVFGPTTAGSMSRGRPEGQTAP